MQASYLLHFATELRGGNIPRRFNFRAVGALFDDQGMILNAADRDDGLELWVSDHTGRVTMAATARWQAPR